jgi:hypothetical protein
VIRRLVVVVAALLAVGAGAAYAASLTVSSWHLWTGSQTLTKASCTVTGAAADTYVDQNAPTSSFGSGATLSHIPSGDAPKERWTFVRFDLTSCNIPSTGGADSATMTIRLTNAPTTSFNYDLTRVLSSWSGTLTWNGAQSLSYAGSATTSSASGTSNNTTISFTVTSDVDAFIQGTANYGWRLSASGSGQNLAKDTSTFASTESGSNVPTLTINYAK